MALILYFPLSVIYSFIVLRLSELLTKEFESLLNGCRLTLRICSCWSNIWFVLLLSHVFCWMKNSATSAQKSSKQLRLSLQKVACSFLLAVSYKFMRKTLYIIVSNSPIAGLQQPTRCNPLFDESSEDYLTNLLDLSNGILRRNKDHLTQPERLFCTSKKGCWQGR